MNINLHKNARTTPRVRREIQESPESVRDLAKRYDLNRDTIRKWKHRQDTTDASHCPHTLHATLTPGQEILTVELRKALLLPLDDLLAVIHEFMNEKVSRSGLDRCLRRHGVSSLKSLYPVAEMEKIVKKTFKDYEPGFIHIDIKYLPRMPDESEHRYLYVGIDRATRWVHLDVFPDKEASTAAAFLKRLLERIPFVVTKVLTDNGKEFTDRFSVNGEREPTGRHIFDQVCKRHKIEHRLIPPRHPQTNGMVERFNGRVAEILKKTVFSSGEELEETLVQYSRIYNNFIPQKMLGHIAPVEAIKNWQQKCPNLFKKVAYNHPGLDTLTKSPNYLL